MTALQAHPAIRLPVSRLAPAVVGATGVAAAIGVAAIALVRPAEVATAAVAGGSVVLAVGAMYGLLSVIRSKYLVSLTTIFMGLTMARLMLSVAIGLGYMLTARGPDGSAPDKVVFGVVFLGVSLAAMLVETPLVRSAIQRMGESIASDARSANLTADQGTAPAPGGGGRS